MSAPVTRTVAPTPALVAAEAVYRAAVARYERLGYTRAYIDEQRAWDAYAEVCDHLGKCHTPGCDVRVIEHARCPEHLGYVPEVAS